MDDIDWPRLTAFTCSWLAAALGLAIALGGPSWLGFAVTLLGTTAAGSALQRPTR